MELKKYTREEIENIAREIDELISIHDRYDIRELCKKEEYALYYFINKAMDEIIKLEQIKNII